MQGKRPVKDRDDREKRTRITANFFSSSPLFVCQSGLLYGSHHLQTRMLAKMICSSPPEREEATKLLKVLELYQQKLTRETLQLDSYYPGYRSPKPGHNSSKSFLLSDRRVVANLTLARIQIFRLRRYLEQEGNDPHELFSLYQSDPFIQKIINTKLSGYNKLVSQENTCELIAEKLSQQITRIANENNSFNRQPYSKSEVIIQLAQIQQHVSWHHYEYERIYNSRSTYSPNLCKILMIYPEFNAEPLIVWLLNYLDSTATVVSKSLYAYYLSELLKYTLNKQLLNNYFNVFIEKTTDINLVLTPETLRNCQDCLEHYESDDNHKKLLSDAINSLKKLYLLYADEVLNTLECDCFYTKLGLLQGFILEGCQYLDGDTLNEFIKIIKSSLKSSNLTALVCASIFHNLPMSLNGHEILNQMLLELCQFQFTVQNDFSIEAEDACLFARLMMSNIVSRRAELSRIAGFDIAVSDLIIRFVNMISSNYFELEYFESYEIIMLLYEFLKLAQLPEKFFVNLGGFIKASLDNICDLEKDSTQVFDEDKEEVRKQCKNIHGKFLLVIAAFSPLPIRANLLSDAHQKYVFSDKPFLSKASYVDARFDVVINQCKQIVLKVVDCGNISTLKHN